MTKEQIEKHGEVIKWFCDNPEKGVWWTTTGATQSERWQLTYTPEFLYEHHLYVQNDEYAELRKAQADGKIIQYFIQGEWEDTSVIHKHVQDCSKYYRIKPDELKFKAGDWVVTTDGIMKLGNLMNPQLANDKRIAIEVSKGWNWVYPENIIELWQPKNGEEVVCWSGNAKCRTICEYSKETRAIFPYIIPYIGQPLKEMI